MSKPLLCLDFDGVCHLYTSGWQGAETITDPPVPGLWEFLLTASKQFAIAIYSSRSHQEGGRGAMINWFLLHSPWDSPFEVCLTEINWASYGVSLKFPTEKPPAMVGLDDRVLTFDGIWPDVESLRAFKPWNKTA